MRGGRVVLDDLSLRIAAGERVAIVGPNGCGKSTLLKLLTRECYPIPDGRGVVRILGRDRWNVFDLRRAFGIVSSDLGDALREAASALDVVRSGFTATTGISGADRLPPDADVRARAALARLGVAELATRSLATLSSGQARRVVIARALVHEPLALVLDEPTTALDMRARAEVLAALRELPGTVGIVLVTHDPAEIEPHVARVVGMSAGRVVADGPRDSVLAPASLAALFDLPLTSCGACGTLAPVP